MSDEFDLKKSKEIVGHVYPILLDARGKIIDGIHRHEVDPKWRTKKLQDVKTEKDRILLRIHANTRRNVLVSERKEEFRKLAGELEREGLGKGEIAKWIADHTPYSYRRVAELLPDEYKREYRRVVEKELDIPAEEKSAVVAQLEEPELKPPPEHVFAEDYECPLCGARYHVFHISGGAHKFDLKEVGKGASG